MYDIGEPLSVIIFDASVVVTSVVVTSVVVSSVVTSVVASVVVASVVVASVVVSSVITSVDNTPEPDLPLFPQEHNNAIPNTAQDPIIVFLNFIISSPLSQQIAVYYSNYK